MFNKLSRSSFVAAWFALLLVAVGLSGAAGTAVSTIAILVVVGIAPLVIILKIFGSPATPTMAEILHADAKDGRR